MWKAKLPERKWFSLDTEKNTVYARDINCRSYFTIDMPSVKRSA